MADIRVTRASRTCKIPTKERKTWHIMCIFSFSLVLRSSCTTVHIFPVSVGPPFGRIIFLLYAKLWLPVEIVLIPT